ncbi:hypothetical protein StoSoilA2_21200 [Arthrobacter sp. StoSoilA2]|nr:hypothetical protein StoSoilA2_21200 [Arthrobacter sp. StoSoilA2]
MKSLFSCQYSPLVYGRLTVADQENGLYISSRLEGTNGRNDSNGNNPNLPKDTKYRWTPG